MISDLYIEGTEFSMNMFRGLPILLYT